MQVRQNITMININKIVITIYTSIHQVDYFILTRTKFIMDEKHFIVSYKPLN